MVDWLCPPEPREKNARLSTLEEDVKAPETDPKDCADQKANDPAHSCSLRNRTRKQRLILIGIIYVRPSDFYRIFKVRRYAIWCIKHEVVNVGRQSVGRKVIIGPLEYRPT